MRLSLLIGVVLLAGACTRTDQAQQQPSQQPAIQEEASPTASTTGEKPAETPRRSASPQRKTPPPPQVERSTQTERRAADDNVNPDALIQVDFKKRIDNYLALRTRLGTPRQKETHDPAEIREAQESLAAAIRVARTDARPGDILTPEIRNLFRRLLYPQVEGHQGREIKQELGEDVHERDEATQKPVPLKVNASYPEGNAFPTVPAPLLLNLPRLPEELEYRIVDKNLILRDVQANIIVDFIPNAIH